MHRFFVEPTRLQRPSVELDGTIAHQIARVLRLPPGETIELLDNSGWAYRAILRKVSPQQVMAEIETRYESSSEPRTRFVLYQALPKGRKFDWVLQKGTELGVRRIVPIITARTIPHKEVGQEKLIRWQRILREAAEQSGRSRVPEISLPMPFERLCEPPPPHSLALIACLADCARPLRDALAPIPPNGFQEVRLYVGPEGGFTPEEIERARLAKILPVFLGTRTLRTETAPLALLAALLYALGEME